MKTDEVIGLLIMLFAVFSCPSYGKLQWSAIKEMQGLWLILAWVPLVVVAGVVAVTIIAFIQESNLWPLLLILILPVAYVYLLILWAVYRAVQRSKVASS